MRPRIDPANEEIHNGTAAELFAMLKEIPLQFTSIEHNSSEGLLLRDKETQRGGLLTLKDDFVDARAIMILWREAEALVQFGCQICQYGWVKVRRFHETEVDVSGTKCGMYYATAVFNNQSLQRRYLVGAYCGGTQAEALLKLTIATYKVTPWVLDMCKENDEKEAAYWAEWHRLWDEEKRLAELESREPIAPQLKYWGLADDAVDGTSEG